MNTNFKIIGLTRLGIKPKSTAPEADPLTTPPSEQKCQNISSKVKIPYECYLDCAVGDPDKLWAPRIFCNACQPDLLP